MRFFLFVLLLGLAIPCFCDDKPGDFATRIFQEMSTDGTKIERSTLKEALHIRIFNDILKAKNLRGQKEILKDDFFSYMKANSSKYGATAERRGETVERPKPEAKPQPRENDTPVRRTPPRYPSFIPEWFKKMDEDWDGQVGLYEWRRLGFPIDEFRKLDTNEDGLFTPEELRRIEGWVAEDWDAKPVKYILKPGGKRIDFEAILAKRKVNTPVNPAPRPQK